MKRVLYTTSLILLFVVVLTSGARGQSDDVLSQAGFGAAVAVAGDELLVGEPLNNALSGRVYVFRKDSASGGWDEVQILEPQEGVPGNDFGLALAASGDLSAVMAVEDEGQVVHVFRRSAQYGWIGEAVLRPGSGPDNGIVEIGLAVTEDRVFTTVSTEEGGVRLVGFEQSEGAWSEFGSLELPSDATAHIMRPVTAAGDVVITGVPSEADGAVYVVKAGDGDWSVVQTLRDGSQDAEGASLFGASVALHGRVLVIGAPDADGGRGKVHVYRMDDSGKFRHSETLSAFDLTSTSQFGSVVSVGEDLLVVSAYDSEYDTGVAYVFSPAESGRFEPLQVIAGETLEEDAEFATAIASSNSVIVIGAIADLFGYGSTFVYDESAGSGSWVMAAHLRPSLVYSQEALTGERLKCQDGKAGVYDCANVDVMSFLPHSALGSEWGIMTNDVWGWTDPETGSEYAIVCTFDGTVFVDLSDPVNPVVLGRLPATPGTRPNWWRDAKTYDHYAYIVADNVGDHGLQIFDLKQLRNVVNPPVMFEPTAHYRGFDSAHNIIINESTGFAYVVGINGGGNTCGGGSHILDLDDPLDPKFAGCFAHEGTGEDQGGYTHDAQCVVYHGPDERYMGKEICVAANETALSIADFTDKSNVVPISVGRYPNASYVHQGWLSDDHRYFFQNDETDEINGLTAGTRTLVWDLAELDDPVLVAEHVSENEATDHNLYVKGPVMYQSNYLSGLRVYDISNPTRIEEAGYFDTVPWGEDRPGYGGSWSNYPFFRSGTIVVTSGEEGVFFLKRSEVAP